MIVVITFFLQHSTQLLTNNEENLIVKKSYQSNGSKKIKKKGYNQCPTCNCLIFLFFPREYTENGIQIRNDV